MEESFDTINLEFVETRETSLLVKIVAWILTFIVVFTPISEFLTQFKPYMLGCAYGIGGTCGCTVW